MDELGIVNNVRRLSSFIGDAYLKTEDEKFFRFQSDFTSFHKQIEVVYNKWFPKAKKCTDEDIVNRTYTRDIETKDLKVWVKYSMTCLLNSSQRVYNNVASHKKREDAHLFTREIELLQEIAFEAAIFMETAFAIMEERRVSFGLGKRFKIHSRETFNASEQILRKTIVPDTLGEFVVGPTSIFLIRQAIELWLKGIFGIKYATDKQGKLIRLQPEKLFDLIDNKGVLVCLPVSKKVITKIHRWSQPYIHAGWLTHIWEIEHAQHVLSPIYYPEQVKIRQSYYNSIEEQLRKVFVSPDLNLCRLTRPESTLVE